MKDRHVLRRVCLATAIAAALAAWAIDATGGFDTRLFGVPLTVHNPRRLLWLAGLAFAGFFATGGRLPRPSAGAVRRAFAPVFDRPSWVAAGAAIAVLVVGLLCGARAIGGADSYGYVSQAHLWLAGEVRQPQPWVAGVPWPLGVETFQPLGYSTDRGDLALVPVYSPGLPLLMAAAMLVGGACAAFVVVPALAALAVWLTFHIGRAIGTPWMAAGGSLLVATSPVFLYMAMQPMSDVPVTAAWLLVVHCMLRRSTLAAYGAGTSAAVAVLIRLNLAPLALAPAAWLLYLAYRDWRATRRIRWQPIVAFVAGLTPGVIGAAAFNWYFHGSPLQSGYGSNDILFMWENVRPNVALYSAWLTDVHTPVVWLGVAALLVPVRHIWPDAATRPVVWSLALLAMVLWVEYCFYGVFDAWWYLRFLLPALPFVLLGLAQLAARVSSGRGLIVTTLMVLAVVALAVRGLSVSSDRWAFDLRRGSSQFVVAARVVEGVTEPTSVIFSMQHAGSLRHYAGRMTLRYDFLDPAWLDQAVAWLAERDVHAYALLEEWEVDAWRSRFGQRTRLGPLDLRPIRVVEGSSGIALYDLLASGPETPRHVTTTTRDLDCQPPAPRPTFALRP